VYVRPIAGTGEQVQISADGGVEPVFGPDGRELFYGGGTAQATAMLMKAAFVTEPTFTVTSRAPLFSVAGIATATPHRTYDISPDGQALARAVVSCVCVMFLTFLLTQPAHARACRLTSRAHTPGAGFQAEGFTMWQ
jgi:hypothetical protein